MPKRNYNNLEIFVKNHIEPGTSIVTDGWTGYSFLDSDNSVWPHEIYNHGAEIFAWDLIVLRISKPLGLI